MITIHRISKFKQNTLNIAESIATPLYRLITDKEESVLTYESIRILHEKTSLEKQCNFAKAQ
jgi:hypothetical protein